MNMNKVLLGITLGAVLGIFDGATAWFTPEVRNAIVGIVIGSTMKGMIAGALAGWFANKVHSVAAGVAFGLAVGALLAFGVCQMQGGKYYFEIMLPGSIVGAIVGWATQRYGRSRRVAATTIVALLLVTVIPAHAETPKAEARRGETAGRETATQLSASEAFEKLKALSGSWGGHVMSQTGPEASVQWRVTAGGSVVMETDFPGTPHEMVTMYTVDGDELIATHYCAAGNQPTMKFTPARSTADELVFDFVSVRGPHAHDAPHIHDGRIRFVGRDRIEASWSLADRDETHAELFYLSRLK